MEYSSLFNTIVRIIAYITSFRVDVVIIRVKYIHIWLSKTFLNLLRKQRKQHQRAYNSCINILISGFVPTHATEWKWMTRGQLLFGLGKLIWYLS